MISRDHARIIAFDRLIEVRRHLLSLFESVWPEVQPVSTTLNDTKGDLGEGDRMDILASLRMVYLPSLRHKLTINVFIGAVNRVDMLDHRCMYSLDGNVDAGTSRKVTTALRLLEDAFAMWEAGPLKV